MILPVLMCSANVEHGLYCLLDEPVALEQKALGSILVPDQP